LEEAPEVEPCLRALNWRAPSSETGEEKTRRDRAEAIHGKVDEGVSLVSDDPDHPFKPFSNQTKEKTCEKSGRDDREGARSVQQAPVARGHPDQGCHSRKSRKGVDDLVKHCSLVPQTEDVARGIHGRCHDQEQHDR